MRSILDERPGTVILFPPTAQAFDSLLGYRRHFPELNRSLAFIWVDESANIETRHSDFPEGYSSSDLEHNAALWLVNSPQAHDAEQTPAFQSWFSYRFHFCQRYEEDERAVFDLYLGVDIPCSAMDQRSQLEVHYDSGLRLHNVSYSLKEGALQFYLSWSNAGADHYGFSLQFFDDKGRKALQYDNVIHGQLLGQLREHRHFFIIFTLLILVMTFPTIIYVFRADVFWLPTGTSRDVFIELWDIWYTKQILTGQADRFFTDQIYYPAGVSLAYDPMFFLFNIVVIALQLLLPLSDAYCLSLLLLIGATALSAYACALWLFKDKWIALLAAVIFAFSPQVMGHPHWPKVAWIAPVPIILHLAHRGIVERRASLALLAGFWSGLLGEIVFYNSTCLVMSLILVVGALAIKRWRDQGFWATCYCSLRSLPCHAPGVCCLCWSSRGRLAPRSIITAVKYAMTWCRFS